MQLKARSKSWAPVSAAQARQTIAEDITMEDFVPMSTKTKKLLCAPKKTRQSKKKAIAAMVDENKKQELLEKKVYEQVASKTGLSLEQVVT